MKDPDRSLARKISDARPKVIAALAVHCRDFDLAEDAFAESVERCLHLDTQPDNVAGWLMTVAKRRTIDVVRRRQTEARVMEEEARSAGMDDNILQFPEAIPDERLKLIFICCHPAIAKETRVALALKVICGMPVGEIARVFLTSEKAMLQRITRAKRKVAEAGIPFELPPRNAWGERLDAVLLTLELAYTIAYQDAGSERSCIDGANAGEEVARLAKILAQLLPDEPEVLGLSALITLAKSRQSARVDQEGAMIPLSLQNTAAWDFDAIEQARIWVEAAGAIGKIGPYQVMATIQLAHARRGFDKTTDWPSILKLYNALAKLRPGPVVWLNRALVLAKVEGAQAALTALDTIEEQKLKTTRPYFAARAELLSQLGHNAEALTAYNKALQLDPPKAERLFLERKRGELEVD